MDGPVQYKIRVQGELREQWSAWFVGMVIEAESEGTSVLCGVISDQAVLHGVLARIRDLGLPLLSLEQMARIEENKQDLSALDSISQQSH